MTALSIIIPAYNEQDGIEEIVHRVLCIRDPLRSIGIEGFELIVVDDGSKDNTAEITESIQGVRLVRHSVNRGYGAALKTGFSQAGGDLIGFLDADGTYPPEYFPMLCKKAMNGADLVIGSRMAGETSEMPFTRKLGNWFFANMISLLGRQRVSDSASGMRVFKREILEKIYPLPDGLNLTPIMSTRAIHEGVTLAEVPIPYSERLGRSKLSVVRDGSVYLQSITWTVMTYNPVRILGMIGVICVGFAALVALGVLLARLSGVTSLGAIGVMAVFAGVVAGVAGINFYSLGVTFNYLVSMFYKRPIRQGLFGKPVFKKSIDHHFWWMGGVSLLTGLVIAAGSLILGARGWEVTRLWFYLLGSAMLMLVGIQLIVYWILLRVLDELSQREFLAEKDLHRSW
jgi:glycosyltransferase involved in cell wall biosynthesis